MGVIRETIREPLRPSTIRETLAGDGTGGGGIPSNALVDQDGNPILDQDGNYILT